MSTNTPEKKVYQPPAVRKVSLEVKSAVLAVCHTSPLKTPATLAPCTYSTGCYTPPTP